RAALGRSAGTAIGEGSGQRCARYAANRSWRSAMSAADSSRAGRRRGGRHAPRTRTVASRYRSTRSVEQLAKAGRVVRTDDQLFEDADAVTRSPAFSQSRAAKRLHVQMHGLGLVDGRDIVDVVAGAILTGVRPVTPLGVEIADTRHRELEGGLERDLDLGAAAPPHAQLGALRMAGAAPVDDARRRVDQRLGID